MDDTLLRLTFGTVLLRPSAGSGGSLRVPVRLIRVRRSCMVLETILLMAMLSLIVWIPICVHSVLLTAMAACMLRIPVLVARTPTCSMWLVVAG